MKKILLIGATGQLGSAILSDTPSFGLEVVYFPKAELDAANNIQVEEKIKATGPDILINTSAYHLLPECEEHPEKAMEVNVAAVYRMAKLCKQYGVTFVNYSTDYVFDGEKGSLNAEIDPVHPLQIYGISKAAGEFAVMDAHKEGSFIIRTSGLYGGRTGSRSKGGNFVLNIIKEAQGKDTLEGASEQIVNPTYAGHLGAASLRLLSSGAAPGIYHLANEGYCSWAEFATEAFRLAGKRTRVIPVDRGGKNGIITRPKFSALENIKAKKLGIKLPSWQEGLVSYFNFLNSPTK